MKLEVIKTKMASCKQWRHSD